MYACRSHARESAVSYRFHVLGVPHTISVREYSACAFTQKVVRLCTLLKRRGHTVIHYGHEDSRVECDEHVTVTKRSDLETAYGDWDWRKKGFPRYLLDDHAYRTFYRELIAAIHRRKEKGDFLLCAFGGNHKPVADAHGDLIVCKSGIGYPNGFFAPFKVFKSYAILHAYLGLGSVMTSNNAMWYDVVIPNYFDLDDFDYSEEKDDYYLIVGRVTSAKGVHIAMQIVEFVGGRLIIAGAGDLEGLSTRTQRPVSEYVECVGVVDPGARRVLMSRAKAMLLPSMFVEPFCGVQKSRCCPGPLSFQTTGAHSLNITFTELQASDAERLNILNGRRATYI